MSTINTALIDLADRLVAVEDRVSGMTRPQLANSSIVDGAIDQVKMVDTGEVDENGYPIFAPEVVARIGEQVDGGNGVAVFNGPVPPRPVNFSVIGGPGLLTIEWLGEFEDAFEPYSDHAFVGVHVSDVADFTPDASTLKATIAAPQGEQVTVSGLSPAPYYVTLVAVSQAGIWSLPAPYDGDDTTATVDPVWVSAVEAKADQAKADAAAAAAAAQAARDEAAEADAKALQAQQDATVALQAADGKSKLFYSASDPDPLQGADGDTWYKRQASAFGNILGVWEKRSGTWESRTISSQVIDSITAGQITSGTLAAGTLITVGDVAAVERGDVGTSYVALGQSSLQVFRPSEEGPQATVSVGGASSDSLMLVDDAGHAVAGFNSSGAGWADTFETNLLTVGGSSLGDFENYDDLLFRLPWGRVASYGIPNDSVNIGSSPCGIALVNFDGVGNRLYRATFDGNIWSSAANQTWRLFLRAATDGTNANVNSTQLSMGIFGSISSGFYRNHLEAYFWTGSRPTSILLSAQRLSGTGTINYYWDGRGYLTVEDVGPVPEDVSQVFEGGSMTLGGGTAASTGTGTTTTTPSTTKKPYIKTYSASWSQSYNGSNSSMGTNELRQGYSSYHGQMKGAIGFPSAVQSDLAGATITKMEVYLYANHWYSSRGGTLTVGTHTASSSPTSYPGNNTVTTTKKWGTKSGGQWITLPSSVFPYWTSGNNKGIIVGVGAGSSNAYYARLNGYGMPYAPKLRVTYTK